MPKKSIVGHPGGSPLPNPTWCPPASRPSKVSRLVLCVYYSDCLQTTLARRWPGFTCKYCQAFELERFEDPDFWAEEADNAKILLYWAGLVPDELEQSIRRMKKSACNRL